MKTTTASSEIAMSRRMITVVRSRLLADTGEGTRGSGWSASSRPESSMVGGGLLIVPRQIIVTEYQRTPRAINHRVPLCQNRSPVNTNRRPPTFLIGAARSGTSLLYKGLCLHPDAAYFNNYLRRLPHHPEVSITNRIARATPERRRRVWFSGGSNAYVYSGSRPLRDRLYPMP